MKPEFERGRMTCDYRSCKKRRKKQHKFDHGDSNHANYGDTTEAANLMKPVSERC